MLAVKAAPRSPKLNGILGAGAGPGAEILWEAQEVNDSLEVVFPRLVAGPGVRCPALHPSRGRRSDRPRADVEPCGKPANIRVHGHYTRPRLCAGRHLVCKCVLGRAGARGARRPKRVSDIKFNIAK